MLDTTRHILERHPEKKEQILRLVFRNAEFRSMCEDYGKCVEAIEYWDQSQTPGAKDKADEYRYISKEIEEEILQALKA